MSRNNSTSLKIPTVRFAPAGTAQHRRARRCALLVAFCLVLTALIPAWAADEVFPMTATTLVKAILRSGPGTSYSQLQVFSAGSAVTLLGRDGEWYQVERSGYSGYMRQDLLRVGGVAVQSDSSGSGLDYGSVPSDGTYLPPPPPPGSAAATPAPSTGSDPVGDSGSSGSSGSEPVTLTPPPLSQSTGTLGSRTLQQGSRGDDVRQLQLYLLQQGYNPNGIDGVFGPGTRSAVVRFQTTSGLSASGIADADTIALLTGEGSVSVPSATNTPAPVNADASAGSNSVSYLQPAKPYKMLSKGSYGAAVTSLQTALQILGYYNGSISGSYDTATYNAVKAFQSNNGTGVDGVAGSATQTILYERTPRVASEAAPTPAPLPEGAGQVQGPSASQVELAHWFNDVKKSYRAGQYYSVYDPATGLGWNLKLYALGNHADSEPVTQLDTDIMYKAFGYINTWTPKPVYAHMPDGRWILATMHNTPHLTGSIKTNGFDGHLCVHFYRDMDEVSKNDPNYGVQNQNVLRAAWARLK